MKNPLGLLYYFQVKSFTHFQMCQMVTKSNNNLLLKVTYLSCTLEKAWLCFLSLTVEKSNVKLKHTVYSVSTELSPASNLHWYIVEL